MTNWIGRDKDLYKSLGEAYGSMYESADAPEQINEEEYEIIDEYDVTYADGCMIEEGKKKCKDGYKWDSKKGKCVKKKKKSSSSSKTVVVVKGRGGGYYGPGHIHGHGGGSNGGGDNGNGGEGETETGGGGGEGGGDGGGD